MFCNLAQSSDRPICDRQGSDFTKWVNCFGSYTNNEGRTYIGEFGNNPGKRDGIGRSEKDNRKYIGEFKNDIISGKGIVVLSDGFMIAGEMNDSPNGYAVIKIPRKKKWFDRYFGQVKLGLPEGNGVEIRSNGKVFKGIYKKGKLIEDQTPKDCDRNKSPKTYNNCQLVYGIVHSVDGSKYGDDPDKFKGFIYSGEFQNGLPNGFGLVISQMPNDQRIEYVGELKNGHREGMGSLYYLDLEYEHIGQFKSEVPHGEGILRMQKDGEDKLTRFGSWNNGKEHGKGFVIDEEDPVMFRDEYNNGIRISEN